GCVVFEMLTGRQAFQGEDVSDVLASVIKGDVDLRLLPANLNPRLNELLHRCLARDRKRRWHAIADVRLELETIIADPRGQRVLAAGSPKRKPVWKRSLPIVAAILLTFAIAAIFLRNPRSSPPLAVTRFAISLPEGQTFTNPGRHLIAVSSDGANLVYVANQRLYVRSMSDMQIRPISGSEGGLGVTTPFFSPDGRWVGFYDTSTQKLKKIAITGGPAIDICDLTNPFGVSWAADNQIFAGQGPKGILRVSADGGGKPQQAVAVQPGEVAYGPQLLSGDSLLFTLANGSRPDRWDKAQIVIQSIKSGERKVFFEGGSDARYVPTGHIVYALGSTLFAFTFDVTNLRRTGGPAPLLEVVRQSAAT